MGRSRWEHLKSSGIMTVSCRADEPHAQSGAQITVHDEQTEQCDVSADCNIKFWAHHSNYTTGWTFSLHRNVQTRSVPTQWLTSGLPTSITRQRRESDRSSYLVPRLRIRGVIPPPLRMPSWRIRDKFTFTYEHRVSETVFISGLM
jgi:hypothetical protein